MQKSIGFLSLLSQEETAIYAWKYVHLTVKHYFAMLQETARLIQQRKVWCPWVNYISAFIRNVLLSKNMLSAFVSAVYSDAGVEFLNATSDCPRTTGQRK